MSVDYNGLSNNDKDVFTGHHWNIDYREHDWNEIYTSVQRHFLSLHDDFKEDCMRFGPN